jgi:hypothetical protein
MNTHVVAVVVTAISATALTLLGAIASAETTGQAYDKVLVDDVELSYDAASPLQALSPVETKRILDAARAALTTAAGRKFTIVTEPGPQVIRLHASIAGIDAAKKDKHLWHFTPVGFIKTRVDVASGADFVLRAARVEVSVLDSLSGEPVRVSMDVPHGDDAGAPGVAASLRDLASTLEANARRTLALVGAP